MSPPLRKPETRNRGESLITDSWHRPRQLWLPDTPGGRLHKRSGTVLSADSAPRGRDPPSLRPARAPCARGAGRSPGLRPHERESLHEFHRQSAARRGHPPARQYPNLRETTGSCYYHGQTWQPPTSKTTLPDGSIRLVEIQFGPACSQRAERKMSRPEEPLSGRFSRETMQAAEGECRTENIASTDTRTAARKTRLRGRRAIVQPRKTLSDRGRFRCRPGAMYRAVPSAGRSSRISANRSEDVPSAGLNCIRASSAPTSIPPAVLNACSRSKSASPVRTSAMSAPSIRSA